MGELLAETDLEVQADYGMFGIVNHTGEDDVDVPGRNRLSAGESGFLVRVASDVFLTGVRLEHRRGEAPEPTAGHEVLVVPPGHYTARITGWGRVRVQTAEKELWARGLDAESPEFEAGIDAFAGVEHYLVQFRLITGAEGFAG